MLKSITFKIDEDNDNDIYEITINNVTYTPENGATINNVTYTLDEISESEYSQLFDELNLLIDNITVTNK